MRLLLVAVAVLIGTGYASGLDYEGVSWEDGEPTWHYDDDDEDDDPEIVNEIEEFVSGMFEKDRRRIEFGTCDIGCSIVLEMAAKHEAWIREMVDQGLDSNQILQMVLPAVQDDCFDQIISTVEANGKGMMSKVDQDNFEEFEKCIGWTELAMRASQTDPDLVLFKWIENLDEHLADLNEVCANSLNELQSAALNNRLGGIEADLENSKWVINDFDKKAEFSDRVKHLDTNVMGLIALSSVYIDLLSAGKQLLLNACSYYANNDVIEAFTS